jgi:tetratricopeptide (TPR) repeat protein
LIQDSLALARRLGAKREIAFCLNVMGTMAWWQQSVLAAVPLLEESLTLSRESGDQLGLATTLHSLSWLFGGASEPEKAQRFAKESLAISQQMGHTYHVAHALHRLSATAFVLGEYATAISYCQQGLAAFRQLGDRHGTALVLAELGRSMYASGAYPREAFLPVLEEGAALSRESGNHAAMYHAIGILSKISNFMGDYEVGRRCGQELIDLLPDLSYPYLPHCLIILGWGCLGLGGHQEARRYLQGAVAAAFKAQLRATRTLPWALLAWAQLLRAESELVGVVTQPGLPQQKQTQALTIVAHVLNNPQAWPFWKERAMPLAAQIEALLPSEVATAAKARGISKSMMQIASELVKEEDA